MRVTYVYGDDWDGVYIDGELRWEGHSISPMELLELVGIAPKSITADYDWLCEHANLPKLLKDVVREPDDY